MRQMLAMANGGQLPAGCRLLQHGGGSTPANTFSTAVSSISFAASQHDARVVPEQPGSMMPRS